MENKDEIEKKVKLIATPDQFAKMLSRNCLANLMLGETRLILAILRQGAEDAVHQYKLYLRSFIATDRRKFKPWSSQELMRKEPLCFWFDGRAAEFAELIGLDPPFVIEQFVAHLGIDIPALREMENSDKEERMLMSLTAIYARHDEMSGVL